MRKIFSTIILLIYFGLQTVFAQTGIDEKLAVQYYQDGQYEKAADLFGKIFKKNPNAYYYNYYIESLFALQDYKTAEKFVSDMIKAFPNDKKYRVELGYVYSLEGDIKKSTKQYENSIKQLSSIRDEYIAVSNAFRNRKLDDYALKTLLKGKKEISEPPLNIELADFYHSQGKYQEMIAEYLDLADSKSDYLSAVQTKLQLIITDERNIKISEALKTELLRRVNEYPQKTIYNELLFWYSIQKKEFKIALIQAKSIDNQFNEQGNKVFQLGDILIQNEEYSLAEDAFNYLLKTYPNNTSLAHTSTILLLKARYLNLTKNKSNLNSEQITVLKSDYLKALQKFGKNETTTELMFDLADLNTFYSQDNESAEKLLQEVIEMPRVNPKIKAEAKLRLGDVLLFSGQNWDANILYQQVEKEFKNDPIGFDAKFRTARFFYFVGEMEWAKVQLDVLKAATSKLIANDAMELSLLISENNDPDSSYTVLKSFAQADLLIYRKQYKQAIDTLNKIESDFPSHSILDKLLFREAEIYMQEGKSDSAVKNWENILTKFPFGTMGDNACFELAKYYEKISKTDKAQEYYQRILVDYPGSLFTVESRKKYRELRGS